MSYSIEKTTLARLLYKSQIVFVVFNIPGFNKLNISDIKKETDLE